MLQQTVLFWTSNRLQSFLITLSDKVYKLVRDKFMNSCFMFTLEFLVNVLLLSCQVFRIESWQKILEEAMSETAKQAPVNLLET